MQAIPKGELHSCIEGKRQENKSKNRYTTIFPCKFHWWPIDKDSNPRDSNTCIVKVCQLFDYLLFTDDHSRVVLHTSTTESGYINANYIEVSLHVTW